MLELPPEIEVPAKAVETIIIIAIKTITSILAKHAAEAACGVQMPL